MERLPWEEARERAVEEWCVSMVSMVALTAGCWRRKATTCVVVVGSEMRGVSPIQSKAAGFAPAPTSACTTDSGLFSQARWSAVRASIRSVHIVLAPVLNQPERDGITCGAQWPTPTASFRLLAPFRSSSTAASARTRRCTSSRLPWSMSSKMGCCCCHWAMVCEGKVAAVAVSVPGVWCGGGRSKGERSRHPMDAMAALVL